ncbi:MAG TPA: hypothetical protein VMH79_16225 [Thermoanaerobaculia bacterium]|nr:hypothetical protein [Thermoanaerobaculia bacterium]
MKLDLSRLKGEPAGTDTRYSVALDGRLGDEWVADFRALQAESAVGRRFELDRGRGAVRFSCRSVDGTTVVFEALERLEELVRHANQIVAVRRASGPRIGALSAAPPAR